MNEINAVFAENLKRLRETSRLSLDYVAQLTGVSKSMLAQIERGEGNPTIATVWKIANGFKVPFTELVSRPQRDVEVVDSAGVVPITEDDGHFRNYPLFAFDSDRPFELYYLELDEGACFAGEPHGENTEEYVTVFGGALELAVGGQLLQVGDGCSARFNAGTSHTYRNAGRGLCRLSMVIHYRR